MARLRMEEYDGEDDAEGLYEGDYKLARIEIQVMQRVKLTRQTRLITAIIETAAK